MKTIYQGDRKESQIDVFKDKVYKHCQSSSSNQTDCVICLTVARHAYITHYNRIYCIGYFHSMCRSAAENGIPVRGCHDNSSATCDHIFSLPKLAEVLPSSDFEFSKDRSIHRLGPDPLNSATAPILNATKFTTDLLQILPQLSHQLAHQQKTQYSTASHIFPPSAVSVTSSPTMVLHARNTSPRSQDGIMALTQFEHENGIKDCPRCQSAIEKSQGVIMCNVRAVRFTSVGFLWRFS